MPLEQAISRRRSVREYGDGDVERATVERVIAAGQGITGPDGRRAAPSAHALYPLHFYLSARRVSGLAAGFYRVEAPSGELTLLAENDLRPPLHAAAVDDQPWIENAAFILTVCGDAVATAAHFADQMPYGQRGERYMYLEAGAAAQNMMLQAVSEGLGSVFVAGFRDEETATAMGLEAPLVPIAHLCFGMPVSGETES